MATVSKLICPDCKKVMRPAKPLPAEKKVKCPECGNVFAAGDAEDDPGLRRPKAAPARKAPAAAGKPKKKDKPPAKEAVKEVVKAAAKAKTEAPKPSGDDEEGGGTYSFVDDSPKDGEETERPDINYAPDMSIKDLRGPAQEMIMLPTNLLLADSVVGFFGYLLLLIVLMIPAVTPLDEAYGRAKDVGKITPGLGRSANMDLAQDPPLKVGMGGPPIGMMGMPGMNKEHAPLKMNYLFREDRSILEIFGVDLSALARYPLYLFFFCLIPVFLGMVYCGVMAYGAVQGQSLESRTWGIVSSVMALVPYSVGGAFTCLGLFFQFFLYMVDMDDETVIVFLSCLSGILALLSVGAGVFALMVLNKQEVVDGFEFEPE
jgi:hypothetical protein